MSENKRREKFQGLLAYFEKFTQDPLFRRSRTPSSTPKKSKLNTPKTNTPKINTPKSLSKVKKSKKSKNPVQQIDKENIDENIQPPVHSNTVSTPDISIKKERVYQSPSYDSDNSYKNHAQKKRRQSFSSVRVSKKTPRRMTLIGCEISPVLLVCTHPSLFHHAHHFTPCSSNHHTRTNKQIKRDLYHGTVAQLLRLLFKSNGPYVQVYISKET